MAAAERFAGCEHELLDCEGQDAEIAPHASTRGSFPSTDWSYRRIGRADKRAVLRPRIEPSVHGKVSGIARVPPQSFSSHARAHGLERRFAEREAPLRKDLLPDRRELGLARASPGAEDDALALAGLSGKLSPDNAHSRPLRRLIARDTRAAEMPNGATLANARDPVLELLELTR